MILPLTLIVYGRPAPQGSKRFLGVKGGKGIMIESSKKVKPWREDVRAEALLARNGNAPLDGPLALSMVFTVPKPMSLPKKRKRYPMFRPDLDKYLRSTLDGLVSAGLIVDDSRVVQFDRLAKVFPNEDPDSLESMGVRIQIRRLEQT